jgi:hypothetical protein
VVAARTVPHLHKYNRAVNVLHDQINFATATARGSIIAL